jgi:hypothetical protein
VRCKGTAFTKYAYQSTTEFVTGKEKKIIKIEPKQSVGKKNL